QPLEKAGVLSRQLTQLGDVLGSQRRCSAGHSRAAIDEDPRDQALGVKRQDMPPPRLEQCLYERLTSGLRVSPVTGQDRWQIFAELRRHNLKTALRHSIKNREE